MALGDVPRPAGQAIERPGVAGQTGVHFDRRESDLHGLSLRCHRLYERRRDSHPPQSLGTAARARVQVGHLGGRALMSDEVAGVPVQQTAGMVEVGV